MYFEMRAEECATKEYVKHTSRSMSLFTHNGGLRHKTPNLPYIYSQSP